MDQIHANIDFVEEMLTELYTLKRDLGYPYAITYLYAAVSAKSIKPTFTSDQILALPYIGKKTLDLLVQLAAKKVPKLVIDLRKEHRNRFSDFLSVHMIGPKKAEALARKHRSLSGMRSIKPENLIKIHKHLPLFVHDQIRAATIRDFYEIKKRVRLPVLLSGSLYRKSPSAKDLDILFFGPRSVLVDRINESFSTVWLSKRKVAVKLNKYIVLDLVVEDPKYKISTIHWNRSPKVHNRLMALMAKKNGKKYSSRMNVASEREIYKQLGIKFVNFWSRGSLIIRNS